jgi:hypothetical protein
VFICDYSTNPAAFVISAILLYSLFSSICCSIDKTSLLRGSFDCCSWRNLIIFSLFAGNSNSFRTWAIAAAYGKSLIVLLLVSPVICSCFRITLNVCSSLYSVGICCFFSNLDVFLIYLQYCLWQYPFLQL